MNAVSVLGLLLMVAPVLALLATGALFSPSPVAIVLQALAVALMVWARVTFGVRSFHPTADPTEGGLATTGPYRFIRHPIYTAVVLFAFAGAFAHPSLLAAGLAAALLAGALARMLAEERMLRERYPEYAEYAGRTRRMVPYVF